MLIMPTAGLVPHTAPTTPLLDSFALAISDGGLVSSKTATISASAGDFLISVGSLSEGGVNLNAIATWTSLFGGEDAHTERPNFKTRVQHLLAAGSVSNPALTTTASSDEWGWACLKVTGGDGTTPLHQSAILETTGGGTASPSAPTVTTSVPDCLIIRIAVCRGTLVMQDAGYPAGHTGVFARQIAGAENLQVIAVATTVKATAGVVGAASFAGLITAANDGFGITLAIQP